MGSNPKITGQSRPKVSSERPDDFLDQLAGQGQSIPDSDAKETSSADVDARPDKGALQVFSAIKSTAQKAIQLAGKAKEIAKKCLKSDALKALRVSQTLSDDAKVLGVEWNSDAIGTRISELGQIVASSESNATEIQEAKAQLAQMIGLMESGSLLIKLHSDHITDDPKVSASTLGKRTTALANAYLKSLEKVVLSPDKQKIALLSAVSTDFNRSLAFVGNHKMLGEVFDTLPKELKSHPLFKMAKENLDRTKTSFQTGFPDLEGLHEATQEFSESLVGLWASAYSVVHTEGPLPPKDQALATLLNSLKMAGKGLDSERALGLHQIERSLAGDPEHPLDLGLMAKHSGTLLAAMGIVQAIDEKRLSQIREIPDPVLGSVVGMGQVEGLLTSPDTPTIFKENPEVVLAFLVGEGVVTEEGLGKKNLEILTNRLSQIGKALRSKKISQREGTERTAKLLGGIARLVGNDQRTTILDGLKGGLVMSRGQFQTHYTQQMKIEGLINGTYYDYQDPCDGIDNDCDGVGDIGYDEYDENVSLREKGAELARARKMVIQQAKAEYDSTTHALKALINKDEYVRRKLREHFTKNIEHFPVLSKTDGPDTDAVVASGWERVWEEYQKNDVPEMVSALQSTLKNVRPKLHKGIHDLVRVDSFSDLLGAERNLATLANDKENSFAAVIEIAGYLKAVQGLKKMSRNLDNEMIGAAKTYAHASINAKIFLKDHVIHSGTKLSEIKDNHERIAGQIASLHDQIAIADISNAVGMTYLTIPLVAMAAYYSVGAAAALGVKGSLGSFLASCTTFSLIHQLGSAVLLGDIPTSGTDILERWAIDVATFAALRGAGVVGKITGYELGAAQKLLANGGKLLDAAKPRQLRSLAALYGTSTTVLSGLGDDALKLIASYHLLHGSQMGLAGIGVGEMPQEFWNAESAMHLTLIHMLNKGHVPAGTRRVRRVRSATQHEMRLKEAYFKSQGFKTELIPKGFVVLDPVQNSMMERHILSPKIIKAKMAVKTAVKSATEWAGGNPEKVAAASAASLLLATGMISPEVVSEHVAKIGDNLSFLGGMGGLQIFGFGLRGKTRGATGNRGTTGLKTVYKGSGYEGQIPADPWHNLKLELQAKRMTDDFDGGGIEVCYENSMAYRRNVKALVEHMRHLQRNEKTGVTSAEVSELLIREGLHPDGTVMNDDPGRPGYIFASVGKKSRFYDIKTSVDKNGSAYIGSGSKIKIPVAGLKDIEGKLFVKNGRYSLIDMGASGIEINGVPMKVGKPGEVYLEGGCNRIRIGNTELTIWVPKANGTPRAKVAMPAKIPVVPTEKITPKATEKSMNIGDPIQTGMLDVLARGIEFELPQNWVDNRILIGKKSSSENAVTPGMLHVKDSFVSRRHAVIHHEGRKYYLEDIGSRNGTYLNGERLNSGQKMILSEGDVIRVGFSEVAFRHPKVEPVVKMGTATEPEAEIISRHDNQVKRIFGIDQLADGESRVIGREDLPETFGTVSREHLEFKRVGDGIEVRDIRLQDRISERPTSINGEKMVGEKWYALTPGDVLEIKLRFQSCFLNFREKSPLVKSLEGVSEPVKKEILHVFMEAKSPEDLLNTLGLMNNSVIRQLHQVVGEAMRGEGHLSLFVPKLWGIQERLEHLMVAETSKLLKRVPSGFEIRTEVPKGVSEIQKKYLEALIGKKFIDDVSAVTTFEELAALVEKSPIEFSNIVGWNRESVVRELKALAKGGGNGLQNFPDSFGVRQKVRDLLEQHYLETFEKDPKYGQELPLPREAEKATRYAGIDGELRSIFEWVRSFKDVKGQSKRYKPSELEETIYQVLERFNNQLSFVTSSKGIRDRVIKYMEKVVETANELYPEEMNTLKAEQRNPYSGEKIYEEHIETVYRAAKMIMNSHAGRPIFGYPTATERSNVVKIVNLFFSKESVDGYRSAQESIRKCVDNLNKDKSTRQFRRFIEEATAEEKALVLETYFGNYNHRHFKNVGHALIAARFIGQMGAYREVGVTILYKGKSIYANLTLGDMHSVSSENRDGFYLMHTHPEMYRTKNGEVMGENRHIDDGQMATVYLSDSRVTKDTLNVLFSRQDLNLTVMEAQHFFTFHGKEASETPWYNPKTRTFTSWVIYKYGMARMDVVLGEKGGVKKTKITFGVMTDQEAGGVLNSAYKDSQRRLSREAQKIGVALEFEKIPYKQIASEYRY